MAIELDENVFEQIVRSVPLCSIDIVLRDPTEAVMLGLRKNDPARGFYFVPGGRIRKNETLAEAFQRILATETGVEARLGDARLVGVYEHFYETNWKGLAGFGTHYVCLAYELRVAKEVWGAVDAQHSELVWVSPSEFDSLQIHPYTHAYLAAVKAS